MSYDIYLVADLGAGEVRVGDMYWNYTSNVAPMWREAMPETDGLAGMDGMECEDAIPVLVKGIMLMKSRPETYKTMNPENGWGDYEGQLEMLHKLLAACNDMPHAKIRICR